MHFTFSSLFLLHLCSCLTRLAPSLVSHSSRNFARVLLASHLRSCITRLAPLLVSHSSHNFARVPLVSHLRSCLTHLTPLLLYLSSRTFARVSLVSHFPSPLSAIAFIICIIYRIRPNTGMHGNKFSTPLLTEDFLHPPINHICVVYIPGDIYCPRICSDLLDL